MRESKQTLAAAGMEEEAQRKVVAAANKADNEIMKLGMEIAKQRNKVTNDYPSLVDATTQATIRSTEATLSDEAANKKLLDLYRAQRRPDYDGEDIDRAPQGIGPAKLHHVRYHDLRHTAATLLLTKGVPMKMIQAILGHSSFQFTMGVYGHLVAEMHKEVAQAMDDLFLKSMQKSS
jgi:Phage integrase family